MKLTKIKLINWHLFTDNEINVNGNLLITGDNGNGKSTLIDAIFYMLSGGDEKNFNVAANVAGDYGRSRTSQRTLSSYMRGKLGSEGKEFLRNEADVITHIALEFYDDLAGEYNILGCVLAIEDSSNRPKEKFYIVRKRSVKELAFVEDSGNILNFKTFLKANSGADITELPDSRLQRRKKIAQFMQISDAAKYFDLLQASVAFKPINSNVSDFVFRFLLKEDNIDVSSIATELSKYREMRNIIENERKKIECLESFIEKAQTYVVNQRELKYIGILNTEYELKKQKGNLARTENKLDKIEQEKQDIEKKRAAIETSLLSIDSEISNIEQGDEFRVIRDGEQRLKKLEDEISALDKDIEDMESKLFNEEGIAKKIGLDYEFMKYIQAGNIVALNKRLENYRDDIRLQRNKLSTEKATKDIEIKNLNGEIYNLNRELHLLNSGKNNYDEKVIKLINLIKDGLKEKYGIEVNVLPLCECIDIADKEWTNAVEGYLGIHRFDLILQPEYFYDAAEIYEKNVHKMGVYGISVVNTGAYAIEPDKNSLYSKITVLNPNAEAICTKLLGRVICVNSVREFRPGKPYITKSCMVYSNDSVNAINPRNYAVPYIGDDSIVKRKQILNDELKTKSQMLDEVKKSRWEVERFLNVIGHCEPPEKTVPDYWKDRQNKSAEREEVSADLDKLKSNKDILAVSAHLEELRNRRETKFKEKQECKERGNILDDEKANCLVGKGKIEVEIEKLSHTYDQNIEQLADIKEYELFKDEFDSSGNNPQTEIERRLRFINSNADQIKSGMREYVKDFNSNLSAEIECVNDFIEEYNKIKGRSIVNNEAKAQQAFESARTAFNENFISKLHSKIQLAEYTLKEINKSLKKHPFGRDKEVYSFVMQDSGDQEMREYARIIMSGKEMGQKDLFTELLDPRERDIMQSLFDKLAAIGDYSQSENELRKFLDYRQYRSYDIAIENCRGEKFYFSKINKEKSGGEMQTPFYVIIGSCFNQLIKDSEIESGACVAVFDEAFNNMDQPRTITLMEYYKRLNIQLIIVVPTNHSQSIIPYVDTVVSLVKKDNVINEAYLYNNG